MATTQPEYTYAHIPNYVLGAQYENLSRDIIRERLFLMSAKGNEMIEAGIRDGDKLIFDKELEPAEGDIVLVSINEEQMCRRFFHKNGVSYIRREDGVTHDMAVEENCVQAVLVGIMSMHRFAYSDYCTKIR